MKLTVECYAGYRGEQEPRRFALGDREVEVAQVIDRWAGPDYRYFKVRGDDGATYILRHSAISGDWELTLFRRGPAPGPP